MKREDKAQFEPFMTEDIMSTYVSRALRVLEEEEEALYTLAYNDSFPPGITVGAILLSNKTPLEVLKSFSSDMVCRLEDVFTVHKKAAASVKPLLASIDKVCKDSSYANKKELLQVVGANEGMLDDEDMIASIAKTLSKLDTSVAALQAEMEADDSDKGDGAVAEKAVEAYAAIKRDEAFLIQREFLRKALREARN